MRTLPFPSSIFHLLSNACIIFLFLCLYLKLHLRSTLVGLALAPWDVIGGGRLRTTAEEERRRQSGEKGRAFSAHSGELDLVGWERTPAEKAMVAALEKVAKDVGTEHITAVAIAYVMQKTTHVFPIVGGRKIEHLKANIEALSIALTPEQIEYLESVVPFDVGFPHAMIVSLHSSFSKRARAYLALGYIGRWE